MRPPRSPRCGTGQGCDGAGGEAEGVVSNGGEAAAGSGLFGPQRYFEASGGSEAEEQESVAGYRRDGRGEGGEVGEAILELCGGGVRSRGLTRETWCTRLSRSLATDHDHGEAAGHDRRPGPGVLRGGGGPRPVLRSHHVERDRLWGRRSWCARRAAWAAIQWSGSPAWKRRRPRERLRRWKRMPGFCLASSWPHRGRRRWRAWRSLCR